MFYEKKNLRMSMFVMNTLQRIVTKSVADTKCWDSNEVSSNIIKSSNKEHSCKFIFHSFTQVHLKINKTIPVSL